MPLSLHIAKPRFAMKLYGLFLLFKIALEYSYISYLHELSPATWPLSFNVVKYIYGLFWFSILFFMIRHDKQQASSFFLEFLLAFQIIPITVIYAIKDENTVYYTAVCVTLAICEWIVQHLKTIRCDFRVRSIPQAQLIGVIFFIIFVVFMADVYQTHGLPTTKALDIFAVYELRRSGAYSLGKFAGYLQAILTKVIIPILLTRFILKQQYIMAITTYGLEVMLYLYGGHKLVLFLGLLVIATVIMARREDFVLRAWRSMCILFTVLCLGAGAEIFQFSYFNRRISLLTMLYSLFIQRVMLLPAVNSFYYYDFFTTHEQLGLAGMFPRWLIPIENPYGDGPSIPQLIGFLYHHSGTWSNNGFISEGFMRMDFVGMLLEMMIFAVILKIIDGFQMKTSYAFSIGTCVGIIFGLVDAQLIGTLFFGYINVWLLFLIFFREKQAN